MHAVVYDMQKSVSIQFVLRIMYLKKFWCCSIKVKKYDMKLLKCDMLNMHDCMGFVWLQNVYGSMLELEHLLLLKQRE